MVQKESCSLALKAALDIIEDSCHEVRELAADVGIEKMFRPGTKKVINDLINDINVSGIESGFVIYNDGKISDIVPGSNVGIDLSSVNKPDAISSFHTHRSKVPTVQDYIQALKLNHRYLCIGFNDSIYFNKVRCYEMPQVLINVHKSGDKIKQHNIIADIMFKPPVHEFKLRRDGVYGKIH